MIKSMTGYGKTELSLADKKLTIEIKSLNSKNSDINVKLPSSYRDKELEIRQMINSGLNRGKIDLNMYYELNEDSAPVTINTNIVKSYYMQLKQLSNDLNLNFNENILGLIMQLPDILKTDKSVHDEETWHKIRSAIQDAIIETDNYRKQEGQSLEADLSAWIGLIEKLLSEVAEHESRRLEKLREKLNNQIMESLRNTGHDQNRFEQEMIYYLEKLDISEEKSRLSNHLSYFVEIMKKEENPGKKLGFITQEIGREINTLGSKANDFQIQKIVVQMKDELEKIKEQLLNVL